MFYRFVTVTFRLSSVCPFSCFSIFFFLKSYSVGIRFSRVSIRICRCFGYELYVIEYKLYFLIIYNNVRNINMFRQNRHQRTAPLRYPPLQKKIQLALDFISIPSPNYHHHQIEKKKYTSTKKEFIYMPYKSY